MMKRSSAWLMLVAVLTIASAAAAPGQARAHVLTSDGQIGAVFHIEPDDSAVSGVQTTYALYFSDSSHRLDLATCDCTAIVTKTGRQMSQTPLTVSGPLTSVDTVTFPTPGIYTLSITGKPAGGSGFQPFSLSFSVRATDTGSATNSFPPLLTIGITASVALLILGAIVREYTTGTRKAKE